MNEAKYQNNLRMFRMDMTGTLLLLVSCENEIIERSAIEQQTISHDPTNNKSELFMLTSYTQK